VTTTHIEPSYGARPSKIAGGAASLFPQAAGIDETLDMNEEGALEDEGEYEEDDEFDDEFDDEDEEEDDEGWEEDFDDEFDEEDEDEDE